MPEVSTQTVPKDFPDSPNTYLDLLLEWRHFQQSICVCRHCGVKYRTQTYNFHKLHCKPKKK